MHVLLDFFEDEFGFALVGCRVLMRESPRASDFFLGDVTQRGGALEAGVEQDQL